MDGSKVGFVARRWGALILAWMVLAAGTLLSSEPATAAKLRISNRYSPLNSERPVRKHTEYIVLHTTEGSDLPSLRRIRRGGLAHYVVLTDGRVHRIISRHRVARHAGLSMWDGVTNIDLHSIGIEVVGFHNRPITGQQELALAELIRQLQELYDLPDERVITHSMVAYGNRNRWHHHAHRGRKRCGMLFAQSALRQRLGLDARPTYDPDVRAGRLVAADPYLATLLYATEVAQVEKAEERFAGPDADVVTRERSAWFIARDQYADATTVYVFPSGQRLRGDEVRDWSRIPAGTRVLLDQDPPGTSVWSVLGRDGATPSEIAGDAFDAATTIYVKPNGRVLRGSDIPAREFRRLPRGTRILVGYRLLGMVTSRRTAYDLVGAAYQNDTTLYVLPDGVVRSGREIRENRIPGGTRVLVAS
jgi:N-acetylmuramoyl-L-alanine amidase